MISTCPGCQNGSQLDFDFSMAFQPIIDTRSDRPWGYEALVRGTANESAWSILSRVSDEQKYRFDQACRKKAIELAARLFEDDNSRLSINFLPNAVYEPAACLRATLAAARKHQFDQSRIMFELTENESIRDTGHLKRIIEEYRRQGFITAIDDFGAGHAGLSLLADFQPDLIKLDLTLIRDIDTDRTRQIIAAAMVHVARELDITVLAEGVETEGEFTVLRGCGINLFQGYFFARPGFQSLPEIEELAAQSLRQLAA